MPGTFQKTTGFVGKFYVEVGDGASPEGFTRYCEVSKADPFGVKNDQIEATTTCSGGAKQYVGGLAEGADWSFDANLSIVDAAISDGLIDDVENRVTRDFRIVFGDDSPIIGYVFQVAMLEWKIAPNATAINSIKFSGKLSSTPQKVSIAA